MKKTNSLFKNIDEKIFAWVDSIQGSQFLEAYAELLDYTHIEYRSLINKVFSYFIIFFPLFFLVILVSSNFSLQNQIKIKKEVLLTAETVKKNKVLLKNIVKKNGPNYSIQNRNELLQKISPFIAANGLEPNSLSVSSFNINNNSFAQVTNAGIKFRSMSYSKITKLIKKFIQIDRFKVIGLNFKKNEVTNMLDGTIDIRIINNK